MATSATPNLSLQLPGGTVYDTRLGDITSIRIAIGQIDTELAQVKADVISKATQGITGAQGPAGPQGVPGTVGPSGVPGDIGAQGPIGPQGFQGPTGPVGPSGLQGPAGADGARGATGSQGSVGPTGPTGARGTDGIIGVNGATGAQGPVGPTGTWSGTTSDSLSEGTINRYYTVSRENAMKLLPQSVKNVAYTCTLEDNGSHILHPSSDTTARTFIIPANSAVPYPIGSSLTFVNQNGAGVVTIAINNDVMRMGGSGTIGSRTLTSNGIATALKLTATEWLISGTNLT